MYAKYIKRILDFILSLIALIVLSPVLLVVAILVRIKLGSPIIFKQQRPGKDEKIFTLYKFRTMTDKKDENGNLLPDSERLTKFGKVLRSTSLDELPELVNILKGDMSIVGPRPLLIRDMLFMTDEQRKRHTVRQGLTGLAQINGRNNINWEEKLEYDLQYIKNITFVGDMKIIFKTILKVLKRDDINTDGMDTAEDLCDYLLRTNKITEKEYKEKLKIHQEEEMKEDLVSIIMPSYNTGKFIKETINSVLNQTYNNWELIIVDDCSTDDTEEIVNAIKDNRIKFLKNSTNSGAAISRNKAIKEAKGKWIAFLDSDDLWKKEKLEKQIRFMEENHYDFSYTNYTEIDEEGNEKGIKITGPKKITKTGIYNYCWPGCLTVMYNAEKIGLIQIEDIRKNNDYAMWLKICKKADCYLLDEELAMYRKRSGSISNHSYWKLIKWHYKLYREAEHQNVVSSIFNTCRNMVFGIYKKKKFYIRES